MDKPSVESFVLYTSEYNDDFENLPGVKNSIDILIPLLENIGGVSSHCNCLACDAKNEFLEFLESFNSDICIFYFCGHGFISSNQKLFLSTRDGSGRIDMGIDYEWIINQINSHGIKNSAIVIDCCHSGKATNMGEATYDFPVLNKGQVVFSSTDRPGANALHKEINGEYHAVFTYYFSEILSNGVCDGKRHLSFSDIQNEFLKKIEGTDIPKPRIKTTDQMDQYPIFENLAYNEHSNLSDSLSDFFYLQKSMSIPLKVLLVKTRIKYSVKNYDFGVPLGLWLLKSYIELQGLNIIVDIYDERLIQYSSKGKKTAHILDTEYENIIKEYDVIGVSICTCEIPQAVSKLRIAHNFGKVTFVGGIATSSNEQYLLSHDCIDYVIPGVSTVPLVKLLTELLHQKATFSNAENSFFNKVTHLNNVATKENLNNFNIWHPSNLPDIEPSIWLEIANRYSDYLDHKIDIYTTRGCNKGCEFCSVQKECQHKVLERSKDSIIFEINYLYSKGFRHFSIKDEDFFQSSRSYPLIEIIEEVHRLHDDITFKIRARIDEMVIQNIDLTKLRSLGIVEIQYGIETPDIILQQNINKGYTYNSEKIQDYIIETTKANIIANCSFILGIKGENASYYQRLQMFFETLIPYKKHLKIYINFNTPHPYKNTLPADDGYCLVTNELWYYTHKYPVMYPSKMKRIDRNKMLEVYDWIVSTFDKNYKFNSKIPNELRKKFADGNTSASIQLKLY